MSQNIDKMIKYFNDNMLDQYIGHNDLYNVLKTEKDITIKYIYVIYMYIIRADFRNIYELNKNFGIDINNAFKYLVDLTIDTDYNKIIYIKKIHSIRKYGLYCEYIKMMKYLCCRLNIESQIKDYDLSSDIFVFVECICKQKNMIKTLQNDITNLEKSNIELIKKVSFLEEQIKYIPGGDGFIEAREHFNSLIKIEK